MSTCETPVHFAGWGSDVPSAVVGNEELEQRFGVDEGWIQSKTGIGARRVVAPEQSSADLATNAARAGVDLSEVKWFVPHQANLRIIEAVGEKLNIDPARVVLNIERYGNTSAASIPIALDECVREGRVREGNLVLLTAFGSGLVWGSVLLRW